jgi:hypothetical protein
MELEEVFDLIRALNRAADALEGIEKKLDRFGGIEQQLYNIQTEITEIGGSYDVANGIRRSDAPPHA